MASHHGPSYTRFTVTEGVEFVARPTPDADEVTAPILEAYPEKSAFVVKYSLYRAARAGSRVDDVGTDLWAVSNAAQQALRYSEIVFGARHGTKWSSTAGWTESCPREGVRLESRRAPPERQSERTPSGHRANKDMERVPRLVGLSAHGPGRGGVSSVD